MRCGTFRIFSAITTASARHTDAFQQRVLFNASKRLKNSVSILLPLILTSLNRNDTISTAMELRGFGKHDKRTWYTRRPFARRDFIALAVGVVLLLISLTVTIRFGRFYNPFV